LSKVQGNRDGVITNDIEEFNEEYRFIYAGSILKKYVKRCKEPIENYRHNLPKILVSLNICEKRLLSIDEQIN